MKRRSFHALRTALAALVVTALAIGAEAAVRPDRSAEAALWTLKFDPFGPFCEGCCGANNLCCEINAACRHDYPAEPQGGG